MKTTFKAFRSLDWALAIGTLAVGAYLKEPFVAGAGAIALLLAWYNPAERVKSWLQRRFLRKTAVRSDSSGVSADDAFYDAIAPDPAQAPLPATLPEAPRNYSGNLKPGQLYLHSSPHNALQVSYLRFSADDAHRPWA
jgi:hypothetical protein